MQPTNENIWMLYEFYENKKIIDRDIHKDKIISIIYGFPIPSKYFSCMSSALLTFTVAAKYD